MRALLIFCLMGQFRSHYERVRSAPAIAATQRDASSTFGNVRCRAIPVLGYRSAVCRDHVCRPIGTGAMPMLRDLHRGM